MGVEIDFRSDILRGNMSGEYPEGDPRLSSASVGLHGTPVECMVPQDAKANMQGRSAILDVLSFIDWRDSAERGKVGDQGVNAEDSAALKAARLGALGGVD